MASSSCDDGGHEPEDPLFVVFSPRPVPRPSFVPKLLSKLLDVVFQLLRNFSSGASLVELSNHLTEEIDIGLDRFPIRLRCSFLLLLFQRLLFQGQTYAVLGIATTRVCETKLTLIKSAMLANSINPSAVPIVTSSIQPCRSSKSIAMLLSRGSAGTSSAKMLAWTMALVERARYRSEHRCQLKERY